MEEDGVTLLQGDCRARLRELEAESVHLIVTSPPYHGLRDYGTGQWEGGEEGCDHRTSAAGTKVFGNPAFNEGRPSREATKTADWQFRDVCGKCGARRLDQQIGLEDSADEHIRVLVEVFRECRRVLRKDACLIINYGDAYACSPNGRSAADTKAAGKDDRTFRDKPISTVGRKRPELTGGGCASWSTRDVTVRGSGGGLPAKNLLMLPARLAIALQQDGWILRSMIPWLKRCLSGGTVVYARTQKGEMPMTIKDLVKLRPETVQLWNGEKWTQVKGWCRTDPVPDRKRQTKASGYAKKCGREYDLGHYREIELRSGERVGCTIDHRWPTQRGVVRTDELRIGDVIQTSRLPEPLTPARPLALDDAMIGWFVGLYIAEGCRHKAQINIAGHVKEEERLAKLQAIATAFHGHCNLTRKPGNARNISLHGPMLHGILDTYVSGEGAARKHLNVRCWERSDAFLMAVLEGYLSGDGHWDERNERWRLGFTRNDNLAQDLRTLCGRLGVVLRLRRCQHMLNGRKIAGFRGEIRFDVNRRQPPGGFVRKEQGEIVAFHRSRARQFWDIEVEDDPHLFALASGVLTHNSAMPESATDRPSTAVEYVFLFSRSQRYYWDAEAVRRKWADERCGAPGGKREAIRNRGGRTDGFTSPRLDWTAPEGRNGRNLRNSDFYFDSLDLAIEATRQELAHLLHLREKGGLLLSEDGEPVALDVNPQALADAHFASFPEKLVAPLIQAGSSEWGCCTSCGAPWVRQVEVSYSPHWKGGHRGKNAVGSADGMSDQSDLPRLSKNSQTTGWQPSCTCNADRQPCLILDPFCGSGTTMKVATKLGRRSVGIELSSDYLAIARRRNAQLGLLL